MAKKEERFEVTFRDGSQLKDEGVRQILVDKETGVNYLCWKSGYGAAITPLLDSEGKVIVDFMMAVIMFLFGMWFYKSEGKATKFLSGYNMKSADERKKYDENAMCKAYGKRMMFMSVPFIIGIIIDIQYLGIGCLIAWGIWFIMFVLLLIDRHKRER